MKWLVDIDRLEADGILTAEQSREIRRRARADAVDLGVGVLLVGGILSVMLGVLAVVPTPVGLLAVGILVTAGAILALTGLDIRFRLPAHAAAVIGIASACGGATALAVEAMESSWPAVWIGVGVIALGWAMRWLSPERLGPAGAWAMVFGAAAHIGGIFMLEGDPRLAWLAMLDAALVLGLVGVAIDMRLVSALSVVALAGTLAATDYEHAMYVLAVYEPTLAILMMGAVAGAALALDWRLAERWARHARIVGLIALVWVNIAFWVGSLWGDRIGEHVLGPRVDDFADRGAWRDALVAFRDRLVEVPDIAFVVVWAVGLVAVAVWAAATGRRSVLNAAVTFGAIHFYTQWFERLEAAPLSIIAAGVIAIAAAWGLVALNQRLRPGDAADGPPA